MLKRVEKRKCPEEEGVQSVKVKPKVTILGLTIRKKTEEVVTCSSGEWRVEKAMKKGVVINYEVRTYVPICKKSEEECPFINRFIEDDWHEDAMYALNSI